jgi:transposase
MAPSGVANPPPMERLMPNCADPGLRRGRLPASAGAGSWPPPGQALSRSLVALEQDSTLIAVIEMRQSAWLVGGLVTGLAREPLKKLVPDLHALLLVLSRWRKAAAAGHAIRRICVAYEAGRDGFWLALWLRTRGSERQVIHPASMPVSREHRRAKSDRLDVGLLHQSFLG